MSDDDLRPTYDCDLDDVGLLLHDLFKDHKTEEVELVHPTDGRKIVTREQYNHMLSGLNKHGSAKSYQESKRRERAALSMQMRFRTAMISADARTVDFEEGKFGFDVAGNEIDIENMTFVVVKDYLKGIQLLDNEAGCFISENEEKPPIRIIHARIPKQ